MSFLIILIVHIVVLGKGGKSGGISGNLGASGSAGASGGTGVSGGAGVSGGTKGNGKLVVIFTH